MSLFNALVNWYRSTVEKLAGGLTANRVIALQKSQFAESAQETLSYDPKLLERVKNLWLFGDFKTLGEICEAEIAGHPQRGQIAAYVGVAIGQLAEDQSESAVWMQRARDWGCPSEKLMEIYLANLHVSLTDLHLILGDTQRAATHLTNALSLTSPGAPSAPLLTLRITAQIKALKLKNWFS